MSIMRPRSYGRHSTISIYPIDTIYVTVAVVQWVSGTEGMLSSEMSAGTSRRGLGDGPPVLYRIIAGGNVAVEVQQGQHYNIEGHGQVEHTVFLAPNGPNVQHDKGSRRIHLPDCSSRVRKLNKAKNLSEHEHETL